MKSGGRLTLQRVVEDFCAALKAVDATRPVNPKKSFRPGVGPLTEADATARAFQHLCESDDVYNGACSSLYPGSRAKCDVVLPGEWALEVKLLRPFGDNGREAEHWSENAIHPYGGSNISAVGDYLRLRNARFDERRAILIFGFEHEPAQIPIEPAIRLFELAITDVLKLPIGDRIEAYAGNLVHPHHQLVRVYGWEVPRASD